MAKEVDKVASRIEEVIDEASGKAYLPPCQVRCPLKIDIQRNHVMISCLPLDEKEASSQILKIGEEVYDKNPHISNSLWLYLWAVRKRVQL